MVAQQCAGWAGPAVPPGSLCRGSSREKNQSNPRARSGVDVSRSAVLGPFTSPFCLGLDGGGSSSSSSKERPSPPRLHLCSSYLILLRVCSAPSSPDARSRVRLSLSICLLSLILSLPSFLPHPPMSPPRL